jgi:hypothetical protein
MRRSRASEQKIIRWKRMTLDYGKTERSRVMEGKLRVSGYKGRKARVYFLLHHDSTDLKYYCVCKSQIFSRIILLEKLSPSPLTLSYLLQLSDKAADYCPRNTALLTQSSNSRILTPPLLAPLLVLLSTQSWIPPLLAPLLTQLTQFSLASMAIPISRCPEKLQPVI